MTSTHHIHCFDEFDLDANKKQHNKATPAEIRKPVEKSAMTSTHHLHCFDEFDSEATKKKIAKPSPVEIRKPIEKASEATSPYHLKCFIKT